MGVMHKNRVAWDSARVFVAAANADTYWWLSEAVGQQLGARYQTNLAETRHRLQAEDAESIEAGAWRARLFDLLDGQPDLAPHVVRLTEEAARRMAS
ncbi:hypothetical protein [Microbispora sp. ATCC PTA-5024]|uniref:hypothetical protein n=1 Tax=Microbispora sp. ATCC PTA-5024 TaxID=316330 RepID=UPI0003DC08A6|nr:hypothetical protein [Microbispora sp. ATCC PTA-5024]ETK34995.1 hypothetical protein MPTA5024_16620 [Microbispora sp. ATCC PTA-5024]